MALKIRMRKFGRTNRPFYRIVLTDSRNPRDGKYIEMLGWYNPLEAEVEKNVNLDAERISHWMHQGAILTEKVEALIRKIHPQIMEIQRQKHENRLVKLRQKKENKKQEMHA